MFVMKDILTSKDPSTNRPRQASIAAMPGRILPEDFKHGATARADVAHVACSPALTAATESPPPTR